MKNNVNPYIKTPKTIASTQWLNIKISIRLERNMKNSNILNKIEQCLLTVMIRWCSIMIFRGKALEGSEGEGVFPLPPFFFSQKELPHVSESDATWVRIIFNYILCIGIVWNVLFCNLKILICLKQFNLAVLR